MHAKAVLREVRTLKNSLRPVNRLPPEILTSCAISDADPRTIVSLTHVCRYWREVIRSNPSNWKLIGTRWKRLAPLCLKLSKAVPLVVDVAVKDSDGDEAFFKALLPNIPRIKSLRLTECTSVEGIAHDLPGFFDSPILDLVTLELHQSTTPAQPFPSNEAPLPPILRHVQNLKSLRLTQIPIYPTLFNIPSLVELKLAGYTTPFDFGAFVGFLESNLALISVDLEIRFTEGSVWEVPARRVSLSCLRRLTITCSEAIDSKGLLSCITLPHGIRLEVVLTKLGSCPPFPSLLPSSLNAIRKILHPISIVKTRYESPTLHISNGKSLLSLKATGYHSTFYSGLSLFSTSAVREFHVSIYPHSPTGNKLSWALERLPALEVLAIFEATFPLGAFCMLAKEPVLCPSLRTIAFFDCGMSEDVVKELGDVITTRRDSFATQLYRVVIVNNITAPPSIKAIQQLRRSVPYVEARVDDKLPDLS